MSVSVGSVSRFTSRGTLKRHRDSASRGAITLKGLAVAESAGIMMRILMFFVVVRASSNSNAKQVRGPLSPACLCLLTYVWLK